MTITRNVFSQADALLRGAATAGERTRRALVRLTFFIAAFGLFYGAVMGTFGGITGDRAPQVIYSAAKVPLLLLVTFGLSLPSFFVVNTLAGVRDDFPAVMRSLISSQAGLTVVLASLAPLTALWYLTSADYPSAIMYNAAMFAVASFAAQYILRRAYRPLVARNPVHRKLLIAWILTYAFVGVQMGWVLRPFVGNPEVETRFVRQDMWGNAYEVVGQMIWRAVTRR